jgi:3-deoxy-D-manno-octulosonic-acid transferase
MLILWSFLLEVLWLFAKIASLVSKQIRTEIFLRNKIFFHLTKEVQECDKEVVCFFCSSAGEYEQARPLFKKFIDKNIYIFFFSRSGYRFAKTQQETNKFYLAPIDSWWRWKKIFIRLNPKYFIVVRYELWPVTLFLAQRHSCPILINAGEQKYSFFKSYLLGFFNKIYTVSSQASLDFNLLYNFSNTKVFVSGDTKYESVLERKNNNIRTINRLQKNTKNNFDKKILLVGSAWPQDLDLILQKKVSRTHQVVVVFHQISESHNQGLENLCVKRNLSCRFVTNIFASSNFKEDVIVINQMGILFELYGVADAAFVGGGSHYRVHNVLEPLVFDIPIAFGPYYKNSHEACDLIVKKCAVVIRNPREVINWLSQKHSKSSSSYIISLSGTSQFIFNNLNVL